jgi:hypothetical protein
MMETALVFDREGKTIYWHEPEGRSSGSLPDSEALWDFLWDNRDRLGGVAHTHPWSGAAGPSQTDVTTFAAIEKALGRQLLWPVVTFTEVANVVRNTVTGGWCLAGPLTIEIEGIDELRRRSGSEETPSP